LHTLCLPKLSGVVAALCCTSSGNEVLPNFSGVAAALCCTSGGNEVLPNFFTMLMQYLGTPRTPSQCRSSKVDVGGVWNELELPMHMLLLDLSIFEGGGI
jgi:hypothetical protein